MDVLDQAAARQPRDRELVDVDAARPARQHPLDRPRRRLVRSGGREQARLGGERPEPRVEGLEHQPAAVPPGDRFRDPGRAAAAAAEHQRGPRSVMVQFEEQLAAANPHSGGDAVPHTLRQNTSAMAASSRPTLGIVVLAHDRPDLLAGLVAALRHPRIGVYLHVDRRRGLSPFVQALSDVGNGTQTVTLLPRHATSWASPELVDAALEGFGRGVADDRGDPILLDQRPRLPAAPCRGVVAFAADAGSRCYLHISPAGSAPAARRSRSHGLRHGHRPGPARDLRPAWRGHQPPQPQRLRLLNGDAAGPRGLGKRPRRLPCLRGALCRLPAGST